MSKATHMKVPTESKRAVRLDCLAALPHDIHQQNVDVLNIRIREDETSASEYAAFALKDLSSSPMPVNVNLRSDGMDDEKQCSFQSQTARENNGLLI